MRAKSPRYAFRVYADADLTILVIATEGVAPGPEQTTGWVVGQDLEENAWYWWQASATDEHGASRSAAVRTFLVNTVNEAPPAPAIAFPAAGQEIGSASVSLQVTNALDPDYDPLSYSFELDSVSTFNSPAKLASGLLPQGVETTFFDVTGLQENTLYYWRARVSDGQAMSGWTPANFFVNTLNEAPATPAVRNPGANAWVDSVTPRLEVVAATDPDRDALSYDFEVCLLVAPGAPVAAGSSATPDWTVTPALADNTWHSWRARAVDEHGLPGPWTAQLAFFVNNNGIDDPSSITITEPATDYQVAGESFPIQWADADPDSSAILGLYRDTNASGLDRTLIVGGLEEDPDGVGDSYLWNLTDIPAGRYWIYGQISDGSSIRGSYSLGTVTVDKQAPHTTVSPESGTYPGSVTVSLAATDDTDGNSVIRYTIDGSTPSLQSPVYSGPLIFTTTTTLKYFATDAAGRQEGVPGPYVYTIVPATYTVTPAAGANGSLSPATPQTIGYNQSTSFTVTPNDGYRIGSVSGCGGTLNGSIYTTAAIAASCTVSATFTLYSVVTVLSPNGGEVIASGSTYTIRWGAPASAVKFDLSYSTNNGSSYTSIAKDRTGYSYTWTVPKPTANSPQCTIKVVGNTSSGSTDYSDAVFTIEVVRVTAPNGGETIHRQNTPTTPITWITNGTNQTVDEAKLLYSTNGGGSWTQIVELTTNSGTYIWTLPNTSSSQYRVKVELTRDGTDLGSDTSNANFTVTYP